MIAPALLVYLVCLVCLVEPETPDEPNQPDKPNKPNKPVSPAKTYRGRRMRIARTGDPEEAATDLFLDLSTISTSIFPETSDRRGF